VSLEPLTCKYGFEKSSHISVMWQQGTIATGNKQGVRYGGQIKRYGTLIWK